MSEDAEKALAARRAVDEVRGGMLVGLGTGSTATHAIRRLAERVAGGLRVTATATSHATERFAASLGIAMRPFSDISRVDLTIDGADEIDACLRAIKGRGGAMLREKIVATASDRMIVIVASSKVVDILGIAPVPVEIVPFAERFVFDQLARIGALPAVRKREDQPYLTDQQNLVIDASFGPIDDPERVARQLKEIPGVVGHGLFLTEVDTAIIARGTTVEIKQRP